tara:strand:+ start:87 stop:293 length:207 start_codon:yes stop_codon:yes gene_type:complete
MKTLIVTNNTTNRQLDNAKIINFCITYDNDANNSRVKQAYERITKTNNYKIQEISSGSYAIKVQATKL